MAYGFNDFTAGDVLTAVQMDGIMRQTVMGFASTSARDTALSGVLAEGMYAHASDIDTLHYYNGSSWQVVHEPIQSWSPTITQGSAVSGTVTRGWSQRSNGVFRALLVWTSSAAGTGSNNIVISTPFTLADAWDVGGSWYFDDVGSSTIYTGTVRQNTSTSFKLRTSAEASDFGVAPAVTIASSDILSVTITGTYT